MASYQVNLPKTTFPMKADLAKREPDILRLWQEMNLYAKLLNSKTRSKRFILHDGPPYANGDIHLGHAFNKILKDMIMKAQFLSGYIAPYVPGWDCHGLPIELNVEKKLGKVNKDGDLAEIDKFIAACRDYATSYLQTQRDAFIRLGVFGDWEHPYATMHHTYEADIIRALAKIIDNGYVERGYKPVYWCVACKSALAEAEVEYQDKESPAIDVGFRVVTTGFFPVDAVTIPIWTTTPWTLPANEAVALHPDLEYVLVHCIKQGMEQNLLIAQDLLAAVMLRYGVTDYNVIAKYLGKDLVEIKLQHPFLSDKIVPVVLGDHVTVDAGTGAVHTAPGHGQEDFVVGQKYNLPVNNPVGEDGRFIVGTPFFAGENIFKANSQVIDLLRTCNNLLHETVVTHSYPHCWRHKTPLIFRATRQWFIRMDKPGVGGETLRQRVLALVEKVQWLPENGKDRIKDMVSQRPDWCVSRQRLWGVPIAVFMHKTTGELHPLNPKLMEIVAQQVAVTGISYWVHLDAGSFLQQHAADYVAEDYVKVTDILDVWFESGVSHFCVLQQRPELSFPADVYVEGIDQYRGWFQSSLVTAAALHGEAPYKTVISHGFTVDANGRKMSKSLGNVIAPQDIIKTLGIDVFRLCVASTYLHDDLAVSDEILQRTVDTYRMLRNTARFILGNLAGFVPAQDLLAPTELLALDRFIVGEMLTLQGKLRQYFATYNFHVACHLLETEVSNTLSSFYFSIIKDRLYTMPEKSVGRRSAQTALFHILEILLRVLAPILSFTAEEIWQELRKISPEREESVFLSQWYAAVACTADIPEQFESVVKPLIMSDVEVTNTDVFDWKHMQVVRAEAYKELEKLRANGDIGSSLEAEITLYCDNNTYQSWHMLESELRFIFITSSVMVQKMVDKPAQVTGIEVAGVFIETPRKSVHKKCCRCWHYRADVGDNAEHPELCGRCVSNVVGAGELRKYA